MRRDPAIRGLATVLDSEAFAAALEKAFPDMQIRTARCCFLRYKPGLTCVVSYRIDVGSEDLELQAEACADSRAKKVERALRGARPGGPLGASRVRLAESVILIHLFPDDPGLPVLATADCDWLLRLLPERPDLAHAIRVKLRYKPKRRYVARLEGQHGAALLKLYSAAGYAAAVSGARAFEPSASLGLAPLIALSDADRAIVLGWVEGALLRNRLTDGEFAQAELYATGQAIAHVHLQTGRGLLPVSRTSQATALVDLGNSLSRISPELSARIGAVVRVLAERLLALPSCMRPIHGDFDASQVVLSDERVTLIDFDRAQLGDPATDLGNFLAYLEYDALHGRIASDSITCIFSAMLAGYAAAATDVPDLGRIRLDAAAALLKLAPHPFRQRHPAWTDITGHIVARIELLLSPRETMYSFLAANNGVRFRAGSATAPIAGLRNAN